MKVKFIISYSGILEVFIREGTVAETDFATNHKVHLNAGGRSFDMSHKAFHTCCREVEDVTEEAQNLFMSAVLHSDSTAKRSTKDELVWVN